MNFTADIETCVNARGTYIEDILCHDKIFHEVHDAFGMVGNGSAPSRVTKLAHFVEVLGEYGVLVECNGTLPESRAPGRSKSRWRISYGIREVCSSGLHVLFLTAHLSHSVIHCTSWFAKQRRKRKRYVGSINELYRRWDAIAIELDEGRGQMRLGEVVVTYVIPHGNVFALCRRVFFCRQDTNNLITKTANQGLTDSRHEIAYSMRGFRSI